MRSCHRTMYMLSRTEVCILISGSWLAWGIWNETISEILPNSKIWSSDYSATILNQYIQVQKTWNKSAYIKNSFSRANIMNPTEKIDLQPLHQKRMSNFLKKNLKIMEWFTKWSLDNIDWYWVKTSENSWKKRSHRTLLHAKYRLEWCHFKGCDAHAHTMFLILLPVEGRAYVKGNKFLKFP